MKTKLLVSKINSLFLRNKFLSRQKYFPPRAERKPEFVFKPLRTAFVSSRFSPFKPAFSVLLVFVMLAANIFVFTKAAFGVLNQNTAPIHITFHNRTINGKIRQCGKNTKN